MDAAYSYCQRKPEDTPLYQIVREHWHDFLGLWNEDPNHKGLPSFVLQEFEKYLRCGIHAFGFSRWQCAGCQDELVLAHSCKTRGFCPSCGTRRMSQTAMHLIDSVIPIVPVRQWVITLPVPLRFLVAKDPELLDAVNAIINRAIMTFYRDLGRKEGIKDPQAGTVAFLQRAGGSINLNPHWHIAAMEGVFDLDAKFHNVPKPTDDDLARVLQKIIRSVVKAIKSAGYSPDNDAESANDDPSALELCQAASTQSKIATGKRAGAYVKRLLLSFGKLPWDPEIKGRLNVAFEGFSIHAATFVKQNNRAKLERLLRYMARPPLALERIHINPNGSILWELKNSFADGTTALAFSGTEFVEKLASIIPPPWKNIIRFWGCFAPNSAIRKRIIPAQEKDSDKEQIPTSTYIPWAELLRRVFQIDIETCRKCGGRFRFISAILRKDVIDTILEHVGMSTDPPVATPARAAPVPDECLHYEVEDRNQEHAW